jgi:hypothetical protein
MRQLTHYAPLWHTRWEPARVERPAMTPLEVAQNTTAALQHRKRRLFSTRLRPVPAGRTGSVSASRVAMNTEPSLSQPVTGDAESPASQRADGPSSVGALDESRGSGYNTAEQLFYDDNWGNGARYYSARKGRLGDRMERDLFSREDLRNAIRATYFAGVVSPPVGEDLAASWYAEGFRSALTALTLHLGLPPVVPVSAALARRRPPAEIESGATLERS